MVDPRRGDGRTALRVKLFVIVLVGASAGLITRTGSVTLLESALIVLCGLGVGVLLVWIVFPTVETE